MRDHAGRRAGRTSGRRYPQGMRPPEIAGITPGSLRLREREGGSRESGRAERWGSKAVYIILYL